MTQADVRPLRAFAEVQLGRQRSPEHAEGPFMVPYLRAANVKDGCLDLSDVKEMNFTPAEQQVFALQPEDVLVSEGAGSLAAVGASAVWDGSIEGIICFQNTLLRLRPHPSTTSSRFLAWWARHAYASRLLASAAIGVNIYHLGADRVRSIPVQFPSIEVQESIADFLDPETAHIEGLIDRRRSLIGLLASRWESEVYRGVTKGLDAARLVWSGLDWAGEIPAHWKAPPVYADFDVQLGKMLNPERAAGPSPAPYLRNVNVQWDRIDFDDLDTMSFDEGDRAKYALRSGDLLVCEGGEVGRAAIWPGTLEECYYQKAVHRVRPRGDSNPRFLMYCLWAAASMNVFNVEGNQATIVHLTAEKLRGQRFPMPPKPEQDAIVDQLDRSQTLLRALLDRLQRQIGRLDEHRRALITAAVTGRVDVLGEDAPATANRRRSRYGE